MTSSVILASTSSEVKASYWFPDGETGDSSESAKTIDSSVFSHLFCAYADLDATTHKVFISEAHEYIFSTFYDTVKGKNPQVLTLLSIGGRDANNAAFKSMASNHTSRKSFIDSSIKIARSNNFQGLDLAWEYPNSDEEMTNFGKLLGEWRAAIKAEGQRSGKPELLFTAAVYYTSVYNSAAYPVQLMKENLDWVNIIAYDFYGPVTTSKETVPTAGLHVSSSNKDDRNGDAGLKQWIKDGLPQNKAVLGFTYVGWAWTLQDETNHGYEAAAAGVAISDDGSINYAEIKTFIKEKEAIEVYDPQVVGHYCYAGKVWIGYEDDKSVQAKVRYAKQNSLLGYFAWNVGADDNSVLSRAASKAWDA